MKDQEQAGGASFAAEAVTPSLSRKLFSPAVPTSIGPTPQRDGRVLGLFDLLSNSEADTPSAARTTGRPHPVGATPRKQTRSDALTTPLRSRDGNAQAGAGAGTGSETSSFATRVGLEGKTATTPRGPESASKLQFATPAFLKRTKSAPLPSVDENGEYVESPRPLRLPRKPFARGLSSIVASLRKLEEEKLDEDLDVLREMEMEMEAEAGTRPVGFGKGPTTGKGSSASADAEKAIPEPAEAGGPVEVEDSQVQPTLLGGFDDEAMYDSPVDETEGLGRDGKPLRVFKKTGQKRTTRLVKMKPTRIRRPSTQAMEKPDRPGNEEDSEGETIPETQVRPVVMPEGESLEPGSGSEFDGGSDAAGADEKNASKRSKRSKKPAKTNKGQGKEDAKGNVVKRAARKVKATAHANFKRLKLKNNGSKGGPGYNSKFRRRR